MTSAASGGTGARQALFVGLAAAFVAAVALARRIGPALLADPEPSWAPPRLLLGVALAAGAAAAAVAAAAMFLAWARSRGAAEDLAGLPFRRSTLVGLTLLAILAGTALRFAALARVPEWLWVDDLSLLEPALALRGSPADFKDAIRPVPYGVAKPYGSIGVLYLEGFRAALELGGTTVLGVRLPSAIAGAASLLTAALLGRALLPAGGGMLTALVLAGLRWHLIMSRWAFVMILLAPIVDLATLALLAARRRRSLPLAFAGGIVGGVGAHVYLSAWPVGAALALFALWPRRGRGKGRRSGASLGRLRRGVRSLRRSALSLSRRPHRLVLREGGGPQRHARDAAHALAAAARRGGRRRARLAVAARRSHAAARPSRTLAPRVAPRDSGGDHPRAGALAAPRRRVGAPARARRGVSPGDRRRRPGRQSQRVALRLPLDARRRRGGGRCPLDPRPGAAAGASRGGHRRRRRARRPRRALGARRPGGVAFTPRDVSRLPRAGHAPRPRGGSLGELRERRDRPRPRSFEARGRPGASLPTGSGSVSRGRSRGCGFGLASSRRRRRASRTSGPSNGSSIRGDGPGLSSTRAGTAEASAPRRPARGPRARALLLRRRRPRA